MWGGSKGSGWNRTQNQAWGQYNDRQKKENPWQQQAQGGGGWNQSGGGRSTQAANAWDANAYKRAATGGGGVGGGAGGWGGGIGRGVGGGQQAKAQQDQGYYDWVSKTGRDVASASWDPHTKKAYQHHQQAQQGWEREQQNMEQEMARRDHQRGLQESPETMMQMFQVMNQMKDYFPEGWADEFWTRMMWGYMPQAVKGYGNPASVGQYIDLGGRRRM